MGINDKYWCAFARLTKVGFGFVNALYNYFGSVEQAWNADKYLLKEINIVSSRQINDFCEERKGINPDETFDYIKERGIDFIHPEDERYPYLLRFIDGSPIGLFVLGDITSCNLEKTLAVVGSRKASENGKTALGKMLSEFRGTDICIVSGLAEGIDTIAHRTAVDNDLKTIAVIGGGFDKLYPKSNVKLFNEIINGHGAVLTEYWVDVDAISWHFPVRNRIVSGLSKGVLVAEAALKSGAMITANLALEQGKELMCMPGNITNPNTQGIYKLLKDGAAMVTSAQDIMDVMNWMIINENTKDMEKTSSYSEEEEIVLDVIKKDSLSLDEIIMKTGFNINDLMVILTKLEIEGVVSQTNSNKYIVV